MLLCYKVHWVCYSTLEHMQWSRNRGGWGGGGGGGHCPPQYQVPCYSIYYTMYNLALLILLLIIVLVHPSQYTLVPPIQNWFLLH